ncbi:MAG: tautomerase family protein [Pseudomonadota bacterium]
MHESLVETWGVNADDFFSLIVRYRSEDIIFHPTFLGARDPQNTIVMEIVLLGGRTDDQKEHLFTDVRKRLRSIDFDPANSIIFLVENSAQDWSFSEAGSVKTVLGL